MTMTNEKVLEACLQMARKVRSTNNDWALTPRGLYSARSPNGIDGFNVSSMEHALFMCDEIPALMEAGKREKAMRWLGYLQGALTAIGVLTLEEAKKMNMPDELAALTVFTVRGARTLAKSLRETPSMRREVAGNMPTERLRQAAVLWEDACTMEGVEHTATCLAEALEEWATRTENGEATYEAADPSRAAVSDDEGPRATPPDTRRFVPVHARYAAKCLRKRPGCSLGLDVDDMPTDALRAAYSRWNACNTSPEEVQLARDLAELLEQWATGQEALKQIPSALTNDVTSEYWLGEDRVAMVWSNTTPALVTVNETQVPITELRAALDHCEKLKKSL